MRAGEEEPRKLMGNREGSWISNINSEVDGSGTSSSTQAQSHCPSYQAEPGTEASAARGFPARPGREDTQEAAPDSRDRGPRPRLPVPRA